MKVIKYIISFVILMLIGMVISYADIKSNNEQDKFIEAFNYTDADFKFYNIKANATINQDMSKNKMIDIFVEIINNMGLEESDIKWEEQWNSDEKQIFAQIKTENSSISIAGTKKNNNESYIIVDILDNKVYKNIVDIYNIIENTLKKHTSQQEIYTCIAGEYTKKLQINKYNDILKKILYNMNAEEIDRIQEDNFVSVTAYSELLNENNLEYLGNKINLNIGLRYSEDEEKTLLYMATPIIKLDY